MSNHLRPVISLLASVSVLASFGVSQTQVLYYKFDETAGDKVINYASSSGLAPAEGVVTATDVTAFDAPKFGASAKRGSLTGGTGTYSYVETGWSGNFSGSFTVAFFMKERNLPTSANYVFGNASSGNFRCFTSGAASTGLRVTSAGTNPLNLNLTADIRTPAQAGWVHVALVVDAAGLTATWYVDGVAEPVIPLTTGPNVTSVLGFRVGAQNSTSTASTYDLDEFRFELRAASATDILIWSLQPSAAVAEFGAGCGASLGANGLPTLPNPTFALDIQGSVNSVVSIGLGLSNSTLGGAPILPLDLGLIAPGLAGCLLETDLALGTVATATDGLGMGTLPLSLSGDPSLSGIALYAQAFVLAGAAGIETSNPLAIALGN